MREGAEFSGMRVWVTPASKTPRPLKFLNKDEEKDEDQLQCKTNCSWLFILCPHNLPPVSFPKKRDESKFLRICSKIVYQLII